MATIELKVNVREEVGKSANRKIRISGLIPAIIYGGKDKKGLGISVNPLFLRKALETGGGINTLIQLNIEGGKAALKKTAIVKEIQKDPVSQHYLHIDFYELDLTKKVTVKVPLHFIGKAEGVTQGGIVSPVIREVQVKCLPGKIPNHIEVDVAPLKIGDSLHISDLKGTTDYEIVFDHDDTIVSVTVAKEEVAPQPAATAEAAAATPEGTAALAKEGEAKTAEQPKETAKKETPKGEGKK